MILRVWDATTAKRMQIDPYCQQQKCSPVNVVSSDIRVMQIFSGVREIWGLKQESVAGTRDRPKFSFGFGAENNNLNCFGQLRFRPNIDR